MLRFTLGVLVGATMAAVALPWGLYLWALAQVGPLPTPPPPGPRLSPQELTGIWTAAREEGSPRLQRLDPWSYVLVPLQTERPAPGSRLATLVARAHLTQSTEPLRQSDYHVQGAALTIWLTRHWTLDELARAHPSSLPTRNH